MGHIALLVFAGLWLCKQFRDRESECDDNQDHFQDPAMFQTTPFEAGDAPSAPIPASKFRAVQVDSTQPNEVLAATTPPSVLSPQAIAGPGHTAESQIEAVQEPSLPTGGSSGAVEGIEEMRAEVENLRRAMLGIQSEASEALPEYPDSAR